MMLKDEERLKLKEVEIFSRERVRPRASSIDRTGMFPSDLVDEMRQMGLFSMYIPKKYGGLGFSLRSLMEAVRIISRECASTSLILDVTVSLFAEPIIQFGSEFLKENYLKRVASGEIGALAITEPGTGSDAAAIKTRAIKKGNKYIIDGTKTFITNGKEARYYLVSAMTDPSKRHRGMTLFVVDRESPGLSIGNEFKKMGIRGSSTTEVILNGVEVSDEYVLGNEGEGFKIEMETLNVGRIGIASQAVGISEGAFNDVRNYGIEYNKSKEWFLFRMADIVSELQSSIKNLDEAINYSESGKNSPLLSSISKLTAGDAAVSITSKSISLLGLSAFTDKYPVERRFREAKITQIYEGTNEIQRLIIGKEIAKGANIIE